MRSLGIDIGRKALKVVELEGGGQSFKVSCFHERELVPDWEKSQPEMPVEILRFLFKTYPMEHRNVVMAFPCLDTVIEACSVPFTDTAQINKIIKYEAERYISAWPIEKTVITYLPVKHLATQTSIILIGARKNRLDQWLSLARKADIDPWILCPDILAFAYVAILLNPEVHNRKAALLIETGAYGIRVIGIEDGKIQHLRVIRPGILSFIQEPSQALDDLADTTIVLSLPNGIHEEKRARFYDRLAKEISRSILGFEFEIPIEAVYLSGAGAIIPGIAQELENRLKIPCKLLTFPNISLPDQDSCKIHIASVALGLALIGLGQVPNCVNLRKDEYAYAGFFHSLRIPLAICSSLVFLLFLFLALISWVDLNNTKTHYQARLSQAIKLSGLEGTPYTQTIRDIREHLESIGEHNQAIPQIASTLFVWSELFQRLGRLRARHLFTIEELRISQDEIILQGRLEDDTILDRLREVVLGMKQADTSDTQTRVIDLHKIDKPDPLQLKQRFRYRIGIRKLDQ